MHFGWTGWLQRAWDKTARSHTSISVSELRRFVNEASFRQPVQIAVSLMTFSDKGISCSTFMNGLAWNVASSAETRTVFPSFAHFSTRSVRSVTHTQKLLGF